MEFVVVDLDGVVFQSPARETIVDREWWIDYWKNPQGHYPNREIEVLLRGMIAVGVKILFLTARPAEYSAVTLNALWACMNMAPRLCLDVLDHDFNPTMSHLQMKPNDLAHYDFSGTAEWKLDVVENLKIGYTVLFAIDDHKPNAEEIRKSVPVLLYEQKRGGLT